MSRILDLGCGTAKRPGAIGVDVNPASEPDVVHDLGDFPYPFEDSSFDEIYMDNVLEHLDDVVRTMEELYRLAAPGGLVRIDVPYFRSRWAAIDPTHRHAFTVESMAYFDRTHPFHDQYRYSSIDFQVERVVFNEEWELPRWRAAIVRWANRNPIAYEARMSHLVPLDEISFFLRARK